MRKLLLGAVAVILLFGCRKSSVREISIIPQPQKITEAEGTFAFTGNTAIINTAGDTIFANAISYLQERFSKAAGLDLQVSDNDPEKMEILLHSTKIHLLKKKNTN